MSEFTDEQIIAAMSAALEIKDLQTVADLMCLLALQAPKKTQLILEAMNVRSAL